jgi:hypothetical protein
MNECKKNMLLILMDVKNIDSHLVQMEGNIDEDLTMARKKLWKNLLVKFEQEKFLSSFFSLLRRQKVPCLVSWKGCA